MKKVYTRLFLTLTALVVSLVMVVSVSYAWMVLSNNPVAEGIQITVGGGNTILVAPDCIHEADGTVFHYPGAFDDTLKFGQDTGYAYLDDFGGLTPVSTADGVNWFIPTYYDLMDPEVQNGTVLSGTMKAADQFVVDNTLAYANLGHDKAKQAFNGNYLYVDFWVVSPGDDYTLRVSTGDDFGGSYVIGLPGAIENANGGYSLASSGNGAEACVRVGLLADPDYITDDTMWYYQSSSDFSAQYSRLRGSYTEPNGSSVHSSNNRFTIYEPNGDTHPAHESGEGNYWFTRPLGFVDGVVTEVDIADRLTVQTKNSWSAAQIGEGTQLEQRFQTALFEPAFDNLSAEEATDLFYKDYLGSQVTPYVSTGQFVKSTRNLYVSESSDSVDAAFLSGDYTAGATDDVYIVNLEKNVPQRIRMFIWLEGQDDDCVNCAEASSLAFRIELAGSHDSVETQTGSEQSLIQGIAFTEDTPAQPDASELQTDGSTTTESNAEDPSDSEGEDIGAADEPQSDTLNETEVEHEEQNE